MRIATIDVGTNSLLLLVADGEHGEVRVVEDRCRIEGLGRGVDRTGALDPAAIERGLGALREYAEVLAATRPDRVAAIGTQALREARNGAEFVGPAEKLLGVPLQVIDGRREAELAYAAVCRSFPELATDALVVCDVGGGSTEVISGQGRSITALRSLPMGAVRMSERFLTSDPPTPAEVRALYEGIDRVLAEMALPTGVPLVATAGTATTVAAVAIALDPYDPDRVQGMRIRRAELERQIAGYLQVPLAARRRIPGLAPQRADTIPAGAAILDRVMARMGADELIVSDRGIRWGLAYELLG